MSNTRNSVIVAFYLCAIFLLLFTGCSSSTTNPIIPKDSIQAEAANYERMTWGLWQMTADPDEQTLDVVRLRAGNIHLNALKFLEGPPGGYLTIESLQFNGNEIEVDIGLRHPFLALDQFSGFDVCGILISNGTTSGYTDPDIRFAGKAATRLLNADGLTRWWNPAEFPLNDGTIFSYMDGEKGTPHSIAEFDSSLNGYKLFCDDLDGLDDPLTTLDPTNRCSFRAGQKNVRHYSIKLGLDGLVFNYAVDASWKFPQGSPPYIVPDSFGPGANRPEAWNIRVGEIANTLWNDGNTEGGGLSLEIEVWDHFDAGKNKLLIESPGHFDPVLVSTPTGGGNGYSTYQVDIVDAAPPENLIQILVSVESETIGYQDLLPGKPVTAYFFSEHPVAAEPTQSADDPIVTEVDPDWGYLETTYQDVKITGQHFAAAGLDVRFETSTYSLNVFDITYISDTEIEVDLNLEGAELNFYDVTVEIDNPFGPGTLSGTLEDGYRVGESWPFVGKTPQGNCLSNATGPQSATDIVYSVDCETANAPETLLIGPDPDMPGERLVYFGYYSSTTKDFTAYRAQNGSVKWSVLPESPYNYYRLMAVAPPGVPGPNNEVGTVYVWAYPPSHIAAEQIVALSATDGSELWSWTAPDNGSWLHLERFGMVLPNGDFVFCSSNHDQWLYYLTCLDRQTGNVKWQIQTPGAQTPDPYLSLDGSTLYIDISTQNPRIQAYSLSDSDATFKWEYNLGFFPEHQSGHIVTSDGTIVVVGKKLDGTVKTVVTAINDDGASASLKWQTEYFPAEQVPWSQLAEGPDGSIYAAIGYATAQWGPNILYRIDPDDGSVIDSSAPMDGLECRSGLAIGHDGMIYAGAWGHLYAFNADCSLNWSLNTGRLTDAALDVDGSLFVADTTNGKLYRFLTP